LKNFAKCSPKSEASKLENFQTILTRAKLARCSDSAKIFVWLNEPT